MPKIATAVKIAVNISILNKTQLIKFDVLQQRARNYVKNVSSKRKIIRQIKTVHTVLSGSGSAGKSHLVKAIYQVVSKELLYHSKEPGKSCALLLDPADISAVNIGGTTIHSGLGIKPELKLLGLSNKMKTSLRRKLSGVKICVIDEISMFLSDLCFKINAR